MKGRLLKVLIVPGLASLAVALGLALLLAYFWLWAAVSDGDLRPEVYMQAMGDPATYDRYMSMLREQTLWMLLVFALGAWIMMLWWYLSCLRTKIAHVGEVRSMRRKWFLRLVGALIPGLLAICLSIWLGTDLPFMTSQLLTLVTLTQLLQTLLFALLFIAVIYYLTTLFCTHRMYVGAILWAVPLTRKIPWQT